MRLAIVYFYTNNTGRILGVSEALAQGMRSQGHEVDLIDAVANPNQKLTVYRYIAVGYESPSFFGASISDKISLFLSNAGMIRGKRAYAFIKPFGIRSQKLLGKLMKSMEHEGLYLKRSDILNSPEDAKIIGKKLHIT